tara:strand:+ start:269 stop:658 length:390 start_codon:yes stop_codon:yes gene_type:complete
MDRIFFSFMLSIFAVGQSLAEVAYVNDAKIDQILLSSSSGTDNYGGCMIKLKSAGPNFQTPRALLPSCPTNNFLTFSCSGVYATKADARLLLQNAQMAFALDKKVQIKVDDSKKHNGYCFSDYLVVFND